MVKRGVNGLIPARVDNTIHTDKWVPVESDWNHMNEVLESHWAELKAARKALWNVQNRRYELAKEVIHLRTELAKHEMKEDVLSRVLNSIKGMFD